MKMRSSDVHSFPFVLCRSIGTGVDGFCMEAPAPGIGFESKREGAQGIQWVTCLTCGSACAAMVGTLRMRLLFQTQVVRFAVSTVSRQRVISPGVGLKLMPQPGRLLRRRGRNKGRLGHSDYLACRTYVPRNTAYADGTAATSCVLYVPTPALSFRIPPIFCTWCS